MHIAQAWPMRTLTPIVPDECSVRMLARRAHAACIVHATRTERTAIMLDLRTAARLTRPKTAPTPPDHSSMRLDAIATLAALNLRPTESAIAAILALHDLAR